MSAVVSVTVTFLSERFGPVTSCSDSRDDDYPVEKLNTSRAVTAFPSMVMTLKATDTYPQVAQLERGDRLLVVLRHDDAVDEYRQQIVNVRAAKRPGDSPRIIVQAVSHWFKLEQVVLVLQRDFLG